MCLWAGDVRDYVREIRSMQVLVITLDIMKGCVPWEERDGAVCTGPCHVEVTEVGDQVPVAYPFSLSAAPRPAFSRWSVKYY